MDFPSDSEFCSPDTLVALGGLLREGFLILDSEERIVHASDSCETLIGTDFHSLLGTRITDWFAGNQEAWKMALKRIRAKQSGRIRMEVPLRRHDGTETHLFVEVAPTGTGLLVVLNPPEKDHISRISPRERDALLEHNRGLTLLHRFTLELSEQSTRKGLHQLIARGLKTLTGAFCVTLSEFDRNSRNLRLVHAEFEPGVLQKIMNLINIRMDDFGIILSQDQIAQITRQGWLIETSLHDASFGSIPRPVSSAFQSWFRVDRFICISLVLEGQLYGTCMIVLRRNQAEPRQELLQAYRHTAALALRRKMLEEEHQFLEEQLLQSQKMESVGRLAGGVAHDFNNLLNAIIGHTELAIDRVSGENSPDNPHPNGKPDDVLEDLREILLAARRSADLTRQLLTFARKQPISPQVFDINDFATGMLRMLQRIVGENFPLVWDPGKDLFAVYMDPAQLGQILVNLLVNAKDASGKGGTMVWLRKG